MKRLVLLTGLLITAWVGISAQVIIIEDSVAIESSPRKLKSTFFMPDFAYPADVIADAREFLKANPASSQPQRGSLRLMAVEEEALARLDIDLMSLPEVLNDILQLAEQENDRATRGMFYAYAGWLCNKRTIPRGYVSSPDPTRISEWNWQAYRAASDSLYLLAYRTAPADAPLSHFSAALRSQPFNFEIVRTVRDFVYVLTHYQGSYPSDNLKEISVAKGSPLAIFGEFKTNEADTLLIRKAEKYRGTADMAYAVAGFLYSRHFSRPEWYKADYEFLTSLTNEQIPDWLAPSVRDAIEYLECSEWTVRMPMRTFSDRPFDVEVNSRQTDSITVGFYRFQTIPDKRPDFSKEKIFRKVVLRPNSGLEASIVRDTLTLPTGIYAVFANEQNRLAPNNIIIVSPWTSFFVQTGPDNRRVQILDAQSGEPVQGLKVKATVPWHYTRNYKKKKTLTATTDANGIAEFHSPIEEAINIIDPKTKTATYLISSNYLPYWDRKFEVPKDESTKRRTATIVTNSSIYHPGDTLRWEAVVYDGTETCKGVIEPVTITLPARRGENPEQIKQTAPITDEFGRTWGEFVLPADGTPGRGYIETETNDMISFLVTDFKLPEVSIDDFKYYLQGDSLLLQGVVLNNVGAPRVGVAVTLSLQEDKIDSLITTSDGRFRFVVPRYPNPDEMKNISPSSLGYVYNHYQIEAITPDGYNATASQSVAPYREVSLSLQTPEVVNTADSYTFEIKTQRLGSATPDEPVECKWSFTAVADTDDDNIMPLEAGSENNARTTSPVLKGEALTGKVTLTSEMLKALRAGSYRLNVTALCDTLATEERIIVAYNPQCPELPFRQPVWMPSPEFKAEANGDASIFIGAESDNTILWWTVAESSNEETDTPVNKIVLRQGYQTVDLGDLTREKVYVWSTRNEKNIKYELRVAKPDDDEAVASNKGLKISLESFNERTLAGSRQHWNLVTRLDGKPVEAAVLVNVYDSRLTQYGGAPSLSIRKTGNPYRFNGVVGIASNRLAFFALTSQNKTFNVRDELSKQLFPNWRFVNTRPYVEMAMVEQRPMYSVSPKSSARNLDDLETSATGGNLETAFDSDDVLEDAVTLTTEVYGYGTRKESARRDAVIGSVLDEVDVRGDYIFNSLWAPHLTTDAKTGAVAVDFLLPNQASTWLMTATAWTKDLTSTQVSRTFIASKPLYIKNNLPRFVRVGDRVNVVTTLTNETDSAMQVDYDVAYGTHTYQGKLELKARSSAYVTTVLAVDGDVALGQQLDFTFRASDGSYGDGERVTVPILPSTALLVESTPFYVSPVDTVITRVVPTATPGETDRTTFRFVANPLWPVVEALPAIFTYDDEPVTSTDWAQMAYVIMTADSLGRVYPGLGMMTGDLKGARKEVIERLLKFQRPDGGFVWGQWVETSSLYTTLAVIGWFDQETGYRPKWLRQALDYVDKNVASKPDNNTVNMQYALVRSAFGAPETVEGKRVLSNTLNHIVRNWKSMSLSDKSVAALIMERNGEHLQAVEILKSVRQYGTVTPEKGLVFHNMPGVVGYATMLEAFHAVNPSDTILDAVRYGLICMRRGELWGSNGHTAFAVRALASTGSRWTRTADDVTIQVNGVAVTEGRDMWHLFGVMEVDVKPGDVVTVRCDARGPAYGAVVSRRIAPLTSVKAFGSKQLTIEKNLFVGDGASRRPVEPSTRLMPGQRVTVSLRLHADSPMTNLEIVDARSTTLEPVEQVGRYMRSAAGTWFYLQNANQDTRIYVDRLPRGYTEIEYEAVINNAGEFTTGVATVTSGEDPDLTAHSASTVLTVRAD